MIDETLAGQALQALEDAIDQVTNGRPGSRPQTQLILATAAQEAVTLLEQAGVVPVAPPAE